jgi:hypothetical protein
MSTIEKIEILNSRGDWVFVDPPKVKEWLRSSRFLYRYDLIKSDPNSIGILDFAIPAFLEAVPPFNKILPEFESPEGTKSFDAMSRALRRLPSKIDLWDWERNETNEEKLLLLYKLCSRPYFRAARITKMLHVKRPRLIPIIDSYVAQAWGLGVPQTPSGMMTMTFRISEELGQRRNSIEAIKEIASELGPPYASLSRLRLYDIVAWRQEDEERPR